MTLQEAVSALYEITKGNGDPFAPGRIREMLLADLMGHTIHTELHGCDATSGRNKLEYKTSVDRLIGRYDVSWQPTWKLQEEYLLNDKIGGSAYHYFARFSDTCEIQEVYMLTGKTVCDLLIPKFKEIYKAKESRKHLKNQTLYVQLGTPDIKKYGKQVYLNPKGTLLEFLV